MKIIIQKKLNRVLTNGELLLIVPPFASTKETVLGVHVLHGLAEENGVEADILYLNILLASIIGDEIHQEISDSPEFWRLGERIFARIAYGLPPLGKNPEACNNQAYSISGNENHTDYLFEDQPEFDIDKYQIVEDQCYQFIKDFTKVLSEKEYKIIGFSSSFQQTNCSVAIANELKRQIPDVITLIGGSNCEGQMAQGIASLTNGFDYIFSAGECETTFKTFLDKYKTSTLPQKGILEGEPLLEMDTLPRTNYSSYFEQIDIFGSVKPGLWAIGYESSRGCWWGEKHNCTFCGFNGRDRVKYRVKDADKTYNELKEISLKHPGTNIMVLDKVMPNSYHKDLVPRIKKEDGFPQIFLEQRANLGFTKIRNLKKANIQIQIGIEALSTGLLKHMDKGANCRQNIVALRNAASVGLYVLYNMLWGLPGDKKEWYLETLELIPLIRHFNPPVSFRHVLIDRFSPYFNHPEQFNIVNIKGWEVNSMIYPEHAKLNNMSFRHTAQYQSGAQDNLDIIKQILKQIEFWRKHWRKTNLTIIPLMGNYVIYDNRDYNNQSKTHVVNLSCAKDIFNDCKYGQNEHIEWALKNKIGVLLDGWYVSLLTATPEIFESLQNKPK